MSSGDSSSTSLTAHTLVLSDTVYKQLATNKKRPFYLHEWLLFLEQNLPTISKPELKSKQAAILAQLHGLFNIFPGPPNRQLIAKNIATLYSLGDCLGVYQTVDKCNELLRSKEHETQLQQMAKLCALNVIGALYEKLGRSVSGINTASNNNSGDDNTVQIMIKYMKSADSLVRIEIVQTFEKMLPALASSSQHQHSPAYKEIYKQLKQLSQDRVIEVRHASVKCLCEMMKHSSFLYSSMAMNQLTAALASGHPVTMSAAANGLSITINSVAYTSAVCAELEASVQLGFKVLMTASVNSSSSGSGSASLADSSGSSSSSSNYDLRVCVASYLAQLVYYAISQLQRQQARLHQQLQIANAAMSAPTASSGNNSSLVGSSSGQGGTSGSGSSNSSSNADSKRQQAAIQQQSSLAQAILTEKINNTLKLLSSGFSKTNASTGSFNLVRGAVSSAGNRVSGAISASHSSTGLSSLVNSNISNNSSGSGNTVTSSSSNSSVSQNSASSPSVDHQGDGTSNSHQASLNGVNQTAVSSKDSSQINRETRVSVTYAYVELANLLGTQWLERNLKTFLAHTLNLVSGSSRAVSTHLEAVCSRKCVQFILRSVIGGMLNEKVQVQAARELLFIIDKCLNGSELIDEKPMLSGKSANRVVVNQQHALVCALIELSHILRNLNTSASILVGGDDQKLVEKLFTALMYPSTAVKCSAAWCLRTVAASLPAMMTPLLDTCMDRLSLIRQPSDALVGYGYACAALLGAVHECPLGIPNLMPKLAFNIGEELLRTASQSSNLTLAEQKTSIGWLLLGAFMTMGPSLVRKHLSRLKKLWTLTFPSSPEQIDGEKKRGDAQTWQLSLESRSGALTSIHSFLTNCSDLITTDSSSTSVYPDSDSTASLLNAVMRPIEGAIMLLGQLSSITRINNNSVALKAKAATFRLRLYQTLLALPSTSLFENHFSIILSELVAEFTLIDQPQQAPQYVTTTSILRSICHNNDSTLYYNGALQDYDNKLIEDQLQPSSASGTEALEHDQSYLYQRLLSNNSSSLAGYSQMVSAALPLGVSVIDAAIQLYAQMYPKISNKFRLQILNHFIDFIQKQNSSKSSVAVKQALQINIFTSVLASLKLLAETKSELGDDPIRKATLRLVMDTLCHSSSMLRCAAGEALGRMAQVIGESYFIVAVAQACFEKLKNAQDITAKTGYALGLGCLHRYVGSMGAGQQMTSSVSILFGMAQQLTSSPIVQVWSIHALYLIIDSGGSMFRNYIEPCFEFVVQSVLSIPSTNRDVYVALGKLLSSLITFIGPELQMNTATMTEIRLGCLTTCGIMQKHPDPTIRAGAIQCMQELHLFAPSVVNLDELVPLLVDSLVSREFLLRRVSISCLRQLCQKESVKVCQVAKQYVQATKPAGLVCLIGERGLEFLLFKMLDIETNLHLIRDLHDIINSLLCTSLSESTLKDWLEVCKDIAISADESLARNPSVSNPNIKMDLKKAANKSQIKSSRNLESGGNESVEDLDSSNNKDDDGNEESGNKNNDEDDDDDDSQTFYTPSQTKSNEEILGSSSALKLKQITKIISPKWPNRVFAFELIRRIVSMCSQCDDAQLRQAHFDLVLAKKLKSDSTRRRDSNYLILFLQDLMRIACIGATSNCDPQKIVGLDLLQDLIVHFAHVEEPNPEFKGHLILEQYQAQVSAALRPQFSVETSAHVTAKACQVCSMWISSGVAQDLNDLRRIHQLLVSSLQKLTNISTNETANSTSGENLIYSELSLTVEKLAVLRAWAEVYIVAQKKHLCSSKKERRPSSVSNSLRSSAINRFASQPNGDDLLSLVKPELTILSHHWSVALKDYAFLCLPNEYANQLPLEGGAFYHADLIESSKPIYKQHFTKILLAYCIWLNEIQFDVSETFQDKLLSSPTKQKLEETEGKASDEKKSKLFFMLLGLSLETLSNTTGLAQLTDETIENILESINYLLKTSQAKQILMKKNIYLCAEILSILYKVKLTRDLMSINLLVIEIVNQINELRLKLDDIEDQEDENKIKTQEKNATALIFVILEICIKDLIKYLPHLLNTGIITGDGVSYADAASRSAALTTSPNKNSFLYLHVTQCKQLGHQDVELIRGVFNVLKQLPFHTFIQLEKRVSLVSIGFHIIFSLIQSIDSLLQQQTEGNQSKRAELEQNLNDSINSFLKHLCSTSTTISKWHFYFQQDKEDPESCSPVLIQTLQSALLNTLCLKNVNNCTIMKLLAIFFQYCSIKVFEPLNVYEKCKVFMCSMRCSDVPGELICMIKCLNEILLNKETKKEMRVILLKEHLSYLLKLTSSTSTSVDTPPTTPPSPSYNHALFSLTNDDGLDLIKSLLDLLESMVSLMSGDESKEQETLTIFVHILGTYLSEPSTSSQSDIEYLNRIKELNDFVINKVINLGVNYKQELKAILEKWPTLKQKIGQALKSSQQTQQSQQPVSGVNSSNSSRAGQAAATASSNVNKTPKIQLNFNFSKK